MNRNLVLVLVASFIVLYGGMALAQIPERTAAEENARTLLQKFYPGLTVGPVHASRYNNILKNDGRYAAIVYTDSSDFLKVVDIAGTGVTEVFERRFDKGLGTKLDLNFAHGGEHLITAWPETVSGKSYTNLAIFPLRQRQAEPLFSLSLVENLSIGFLDEDLILIIQRWPNLVNNDDNIRPSKSIYFMLGYDQSTGAYKLTRHLVKLPDAASDVSARLNNQALDSYARGDLNDARDMLDKVVGMGGAGAAVSRRNLILVTREIEGLELQKVVSEGAIVTPSYDDARLSFFTGNYQDCINIIRNQGTTATADKMAMLAFSYAYAEQWGDLSAVYSALHSADTGFKSELLSYLVDILDGSKNTSQFFEYMRKLEELDKYHPNLIAHKAKLLVLNNRQKDAAGLLDKYLARFQVSPRYRAKLLLIRWEIGYYQKETERMKEIEDELNSMPKPDLSYLVEMLNFSVETAPDSASGYPLKEMQGRDLEGAWNEVKGG